MTKRCVAAAALSALLLSSAARADDLDRERASMLRAQPGSSTEPAWLVERADNTSLRISILSQTRFTASTRESGFIANGDNATYGFSQPRTRVSFDGSVVSSQLSYRVSFDFGDA